MKFKLVADVHKWCGSCEIFLHGLHCSLFTQHKPSKHQWWCVRWIWSTLNVLLSSIKTLTMSLARLYQLLIHLMKHWAARSDASIHQMCIYRRKLSHTDQPTSAAVNPNWVGSPLFGLVELVCGRKQEGKIIVITLTANWTIYPSIVVRRKYCITTVPIRHRIPLCVSKSQL